MDRDQRTYRQNDLTKELQTLLDALLSSKSISVVIISGVKILNAAVPADLTVVYNKSNRQCIPRRTSPERAFVCVVASDR